MMLYRNAVRRTELETMARLRLLQVPWATIAERLGRTEATCKTLFCRWRKGKLETTLAKTERRIAIFEAAEAGLTARQICERFGFPNIAHTCAYLAVHGYDAEVRREFRHGA